MRLHGRGTWRYKNSPTTKDIVNYKKSPPKTLDSRMVISRVHGGLCSYNGTVVQMRFLYTGARTVALICLIAIAYFYFMMYFGMRKRKINAIDQVNDALINAKMESKIGRMTALLTAALICSFPPSIGNYTLGNCLPSFYNKFVVPFNGGTCPGRTFKAAIRRGYHKHPSTTQRV